MQRAANLVENYVGRRVPAAQKRVKHVVAQGSSSLMLIRTAFPVAAPPTSRVPNKERLGANRKWCRRRHQILDQGGSGGSAGWSVGGGVGAERRERSEA
jgi:hypothetical protein